MKKNDQSGFTLIEVLMAVGLVAILVTIAITQYTDFTTDTKNAAVKQSLSVLREGIMRQMAQARIRCSYSAASYPTTTILNANDITTGATICTTTAVSSAADRKFVAGDLPENPWSTSSCTTAQRKGIVVSAGVNVTGTASAPQTPTNCGWQYDVSSGTITANSAQNGGGAGLTENAF